VAGVSGVQAKRLGYPAGQPLADVRCLASKPAGIFYTGSCLLQLSVSIGARKRLAGVLGSSCHLFIFRKNQ
jgi:hypothetical protein